MQNETNISIRLAWPSDASNTILMIMSQPVQQFCSKQRCIAALCRVERQRAEELQAALQRAQEHILDLQEQHRLDLESCKRGHAAETAHLRSNCYSFQNDLAEARQALLLALCFPCWALQWIHLAVDMYLGYG